MTTILMTKMLAGVQPRVLPLGYAVTVLSALALLSTTTLTAADVLSGVSIEGNPAETPAGPSILDVVAGSSALDAGNGVTFTVGDSGSNARYISSSTVFRAGGVARMNGVSSLGYQPFSATYATYPTASLQTYAVNIYITGTVTTPADGSIYLKVEYSYDP